MLKGDGFGPHSDRHGARLRKQIEVGAPGILRRVREVEPAREGSLERVERAKAALRVVEVGARKKKRGPARFEGVRPWEAEGMSRATWFRRKKEVGGG